MEFDCTKRGDTTIVAPNGSINTESSPKLEKKLLELLNASELRVVVDFAKVDYISSAGLRVLLMTAKRLKAKDGALALCCLSPGVAKVFALCGFERDFTIVPDREQALERVAVAAASAPDPGRPADRGCVGAGSPPDAARADAQPRATPDPKAEPPRAPVPAKIATEAASTKEATKKPVSVAKVRVAASAPPSSEAAAPISSEISALARDVVRVLAAGLGDAAPRRRADAGVPAELVRRARLALGT